MNRGESMQLNQFKFLVAVDQYGSISKAAQELYISQSTVSLALINLEEELGFTILNRSKRGVSFTPEGKQVLAKAKAIMDEVESLQTIGCSMQEITGDVRIGGSSHFGMNIITDMMIQMKRQHPGIRILTQREYIKDIVKAVAQKELDLAFVNFNTLNDSDIQNEIRRYHLEFRQIFQDRLRICVGQDHPLYGKEQIPFADLLQYDLVSLAFRMDEFTYNFFKQRGYQKESISINDIANLRKYATRLDALMIMLEKEIENSNKTYLYQLYGLDVPEFEVTVTVGWLHHGDHEMTLPEQKVVELLERECQRFQDLSTKEEEHGS